MPQWPESTYFLVIMFPAGPALLQCQMPSAELSIASSTGEIGDCAGKLKQCGAKRSNMRHEFI